MTSWPLLCRVCAQWGTGTYQVQIFTGFTEEEALHPILLGLLHHVVQRGVATPATLDIGLGWAPALLPSGCSPDIPPLLSIPAARGEGQWSNCAVQALPGDWFWGAEGSGIAWTPLSSKVWPGQSLHIEWLARNQSRKLSQLVTRNKNSLSSPWAWQEVQLLSIKVRIQNWELIPNSICLRGHPSVQLNTSRWEIILQHP